MVRIMNRITSIISAISIFISCIAGYRTENTEFDDLEALAISAALSYRTLAWNGSIDTDTPEFAWNTAGWYAAYKANLEFSDDAVLSGDQLKEIQSIILSGKTAAAPPDTVNTKCVVLDGKTCWEFPEINEYFRSYLGVSSEVNCEKTGDSTFVVTIREHLRFNAVEEIVFSIGFNKKNDGYALSEFSRSEFYDLDFTPELLHDANLLSNLLPIYENLTITEDYSNGFGAISHSIKTDNGYAFWIDGGSVGHYDEYSFYTDDNGKVSVMPADTSPEWLDDYVANMMLPGDGADFIRLTCTQEEEMFFIDYGSSSTVYTIDRGTLALKKVESFDENDVSYYTAKFDYGKKVTEPDTIAAWKKPLRTVTLNLLYSDGRTVRQTFRIPSDWEFDAAEYCRWGTVYLDKGCTKPYKYPGNGINYTLYVCEGAG